MPPPEAIQGIFDSYSPQSGIHFCYQHTPGSKYRTLFLYPPDADHPTTGGTGITARNLERAEIALPGILPEILHCQGKIAFLGNGFSPLALYAARLHNIGWLSEPPVLVDMINYYQVYQDILEFRQLLGEPLGQEFLGYQQEQFEQLLFSPFAPALHFVQYRFGSGIIPAP